MLYALLLLPLARREFHVGRDLAFANFALGMVSGAMIVSLAVLWERAAYPGLLNATAPYRTTALFWEMHVGGAAIDAYLAICTPFVAWALWSARSKWHWAAAAVLSLVWFYACLTTFSRGLYLTVILLLLLLGLLLSERGGPRWLPVVRTAAFGLGSASLLALVLDRWGHGRAALVLLAMGAALLLAYRKAMEAKGWRVFAACALGLVLIFEGVVVLSPGSFMMSRIVDSARDYESRTAHWLHGIGLLKDAGDWLLGLGLGRLPVHYDRFAPGGEFPGRVQWARSADGSGSVKVLGPRSMADLGGLHGLTQRVPLQAAYSVRFDVRVETVADVLIRVCAAHLLYDSACQAVSVQLQPSDGNSWQRLALRLDGPPLTVGRWVAQRQGVFTLSVLNAGGIADFDNLTLETVEGKQLLENGDFSAGLAHWLPAAQYHFLPWHIDNLYLELLIERGVVGLLIFLALAGAVLWRQLKRSDGSAPFIAASLFGALGVGLVSSVLDVPRVAFLLCLLLVVAAQIEPRR